MAKREIYLDNSATTRVLPEVAERMRTIYEEHYGNPSSMHHKGVEAEKYVRDAKRTFGEILGVSPKTFVFTSCGTESDNLALIGTCLAHERRGKHLVTTRIEHPAILETMRFLESMGFAVDYLPVDGNGLVDPALLERTVREDTLLVSVMHTNNEIGTVEPIEELSRAAKRANPKVLFHTDAVQGFGKAWIQPKKQGIDLLSASGHKIHGPKGVGLLYIGEGVRIRNILFGGGQQGGMRSGTENVPGIAGMAYAADLLYRDLDAERERLYGLRDEFLRAVDPIPGIHVNGGRDKESTAPHIISISVEGVRAEVLLHALEDRGVYVSSGSACSSNHPQLSGTLQAVGVRKDLLDSTIRLSMSVETTREDVLEAAGAIADLVPFLRRYTRS